MSSTRSRRALRRINHRIVRIAAAVAVAMTAGVAATAMPAAAQVPALGTWLHHGSAGPAVKRVQDALHLAHTGRFGSRTRRAVVAYQRNNGLLVDGIVGPQTWDTLFGIKPLTPAPTSTNAAAPASAASPSGAYTIPASIVQCESGGDYSAVNPQSGAGGAYQILPSTWHAHGGHGSPQDASPAEQGRIASEIYASQGASAWTC